MKKTFILILSIVCVSNFVFAQESSKAPFLNFDNGESKTLGSNLEKDVYLPLWKLRGRSSKIGDYRNEADCLYIIDFLIATQQKLYAYQNMRWIAAQYSEKSERVIEFLISYLERHCSNIPKSINSIKGMIKKSKDDEFVALANKAIPVLERINSYYEGQRSFLKKFQKEQFR